MCQREVCSSAKPAGDLMEGSSHERRDYPEMERNGRCTEYDSEVTDGW